MKALLLSVAILFINDAWAQSRFGFEFVINQLKTENTGHLIGGGTGFTAFTITNEADPTTWSYSVGVIYKINERHLFKLHLGKHRNGRIIDLIEYSDVVGEIHYYYGVDKPYLYAMLAPSYTYRLLNKKLVVPIELGFQVNKVKRELQIFYVSLHQYNFDLSASVGVQYRLSKKLMLGMQGKYLHYLTEYQDMYVFGTYKPVQYGFGVSMMYEL